MINIPKFAKPICIILVLMLILCSCTKTEIETGDTEAVPTPQKAISLPYCPTDTLNPYECESQMNLDLASLFCEPLYDVDSSLSPINCLGTASVTEGDKLTVVLRAAKFSDGTSLTPEDVVYSFQTAKNSDNYSASLSVFSGCEALGTSVVFTLKRTNKYALSLLTFPIIKYESDKNDQIPIGTGKYKLKDSCDGFEMNTYYRSVPTDIASINLVAVTDSEKLCYNLETGKIDALTYNLSSFRYPGLLTNVRKTSSNSLVFLGFNSSSTLAGHSEIRRAVSLCLNRNEFANAVYSSCGTPTYTPFNPRWYEIENLPLSVEDTSVDTAKAGEILSAFGYDTIQDSGIRRNSYGSLTLNLIVYRNSEYKTSAAETIKTTLAKAGINVTVSSYSREDFFTALESGSYDMYLGEVKLPYDCDLSCFFSSNGSVSYGINTSSECAEKYFEFRDESCDITDFLDAFFDEIPFVPLCFRQDILVANNSKITFGTNNTVNNLYYDIENWTVTG